MTYISDLAFAYVCLHFEEWLLLRLRLAIIPPPPPLQFLHGGWVVTVRSQLNPPNSFPTIHPTFLCNIPNGLTVPADVQFSPTTFTIY